MTYTIRRIEAESRLSHICKDHWRRYESDQEHEERVEAAQVSAARLFHGSVTGQKAALDAVLAVWPANYAPSNERKRDAARRDYEASTAEAFDLYVRSVDDLLRYDEIQPETWMAWDALCNRPEMAECAA